MIWLYYLCMQEDVCVVESKYISTLQVIILKVTGELVDYIAHILKPWQNLKNVSLKTRCLCTEMDIVILCSNKDPAMMVNGLFWILQLMAHSYHMLTVKKPWVVMFLPWQQIMRVRIYCVLIPLSEIMFDFVQFSF